MQKEVFKMIKRIFSIRVKDLIVSPPYVAIHSEDLMNIHETINKLVDKSNEFEKALQECKKQNEKILSQFSNAKEPKPETPDYVNNKDLFESINFSIKASDGDDDYFVGLRNGLRLAKSFIDGQEPQYEKTLQNKWTLITEEQPRKTGTILASVGGILCIAFYNATTEDVTMTSGFVYRVADIKDNDTNFYWMPLPEQPKKDGVE
jgi:hypothetical protein